MDLLLEHKNILHVHIQLDQLGWFPKETSPKKAAFLNVIELLVQFSQGAFAIVEGGADAAPEVAITMCLRSYYWILCPRLANCLQHPR